MAQGGGLAVLNPDVLTRGSSMPSPVTQLAPVVEDVPAMVSSMCTTLLSLPLHQVLFDDMICVQSVQPL
jgi:hypothetical protein